MMKNVLNTDLTGKVCVVTGAGGAICGMFAKTLARAGGKVAVLDLNEQAAQQVADEINAEGGIAKAYKANVLEKENLEAVHQQVLVDLGPCDVLINGAGGNNPRATTDNEFHFEAKDIEGCKTFFDLDKSGVEFVFALNWLGTLLPTQVFAVDMIDRDGNILNIASMNAYTPLTKIPAYSGAKAAIVNFTEWLATYFAKSGIRVNAIAPGFFVGNQNRRLLFNEDGTPTARTAKILAGTPMGRFGELNELEGAVLFLLNNAAAGFITGVCIPIDGGYAAYSGV
ncbi:MAG: SDR family oxidoreductase [Butyricicoccus pullicaecorum]|nr:SDR family oxidoreductase [Butyricicoccus pullicaecorum]